MEAWDVILADYAMPGFSGLAALNILRESGRDIPFIIVSGTIGEETAVEALKAGAHDFLVKDRLARLLPAIEREIREARIRRERLDATALLDSLYATAPIGLAFIDREFRYVRINDMLAAINGVSAAEHVGRRVRDVLPELGVKLEETHRRVLETGEPVLNVEVSGETPAAPGAQRHWLVNYYPVCDDRGAILGVGSVVVEITERKRAETERERLVGELAEAVKLRDDFLSIASHELRTPLTPLLLQVNILRARMEVVASGRAPRDWLEGCVERIARQGRRLERLVGQLLDVSRITTGRFTLDLDTVDLSEVVREAHERVTETGELRRSGSTLDVEAEEHVVGRWDRLRLEQVVENLLSNALKYGAGKPIQISVSRSDSNAVLVVADQGIGVSEEDQKRIFGRFERAVSPRHYGGLGMGLFVVQQVVDAHGGSIEVESTSGQGSRFVVRLPLAGPSESLSGPVSNKEGSGEEEVVRQ
jgi:PAS domain S-box-containing protein